MSRRKALKIAPIIADHACVEPYPENNSTSLARALYISAKGTKHFYEALELLAQCYPDTAYSKEFEELKNKQE